ncbi:MAG: hypothetical protein ACN4EU_15700 [Brevundimonas mediterranea]|jgi:hypothetical protein
MIENLDGLVGDGERAGAFTRHIIEGYLDPAFGSRSKAEIDLLIFTALVKSGAIDPNGPIYAIARAFNITPGRARTLVLNWQLRDETYRGELTDKLRTALSRTKFGNDGSYLAFGIESPLLKEEIVARLKADGVFADATFSKDIVRLPVEAFVEFLDDLVDDAVKAQFVAELVLGRQIADRSFKGIMKGVLGKMASKVGGAFAEEMAEDLAGGLVEAAAPVAERIGGFVGGLLRNGADAAIAFVQPDEKPGNAPVRNAG